MIVFLRNAETRALMRKFHNICVWCSRTVVEEYYLPNTATVDHIITKTGQNSLTATRGRRRYPRGTTKKNHLLLACQECNFHRGNTEFKKFKDRTRNRNQAEVLEQAWNDFRSA